MAHTSLSRAFISSNRLTKVLRTSSSLQRLDFNESVSCQPFNVGTFGSWPSIFYSCFHTYKFTNNITFSSEHKIVKPRNLQILNENSQARPLILYFSWLKAKETNCSKYIQMYTDLGYDVLRVAINPGDLWRPVKRMHVVAADVANFLERNEKFSQILVHGMSVGAYAFCEIIFKMSQDLDRYKPTLDRFVGQIWDSPVDVHNAPMGTSKSMTQNPRVQKAIQAAFTKFMAWKYDDITYYYYRASDIFHSNYINVPSLLLVSKIDPVSDLKSNQALFEEWKAIGKEANMICFEDSPHVLHLRYNKEEYEREVVKFLRKVVTIPPIQAVVPENSLHKPDIALELA